MTSQDTVTGWPHGVRHCRQGCRRPGSGRQDARPPSPRVGRWKTRTRTGTRADAWRRSLSATSWATTTSVASVREASVPERASTSRSSTRADNRPTSGRSSSGRLPPSPTRAATSSSVRMLVSGLRSSCAASATKARCRARPASSRCQHAVERDRQGRWTSSRDSGTGSRHGRGRRYDLARAPRPAATSTGRSAAPSTRHSTAASRATNSGTGDQQRVAGCVRPVDRGRRWNGPPARVNGGGAAARPASTITTRGVAREPDPASRGSAARPDPTGRPSQARPRQRIGVSRSAPADWPVTRFRGR